MSQIWDDGDQNPIFLGASSTQAPRVWFTFLFLFSLCYFCIPFLCLSQPTSRLSPLSFHVSLCHNPRLACRTCIRMSRLSRLSWVVSLVLLALSCLVYPACFALSRLSLMSCVVAQCLNPSLVCLTWLELSRLSNLSWVVSLVSLASLVLRCLVVSVFLQLLALKASRKDFVRLKTRSLAKPT
jgi:hypothetical protein